MRWRRKAAGWNVTIVSSDKDLMQLVQPGIDLLDTMKNQRIDRAEVMEKFGVPPEQVGEVLALMGDTADNVPGVRGVGPKTAAELIQQYGTVEGVIAHIDEIKKPKLKETLAASVDDARLSRELVRLKDDIPLAEPLDALTLRHPPHEPLAKFLAKHGFRGMLAKLGREAEAAHAMPEKAEAAPVKPFVHSDYETVTTMDRLDWWVAEAVKRGAVAVDTETTGVDQCRADLLGISLAIDAGVACYIPLAHQSGEGLLAEKVPQLGMAEVIARLNPLFADPGVLKIGQNIKYDMIVLRRHGVPVLAPFDDTMLLSYALDAGRWNHGMDDLSTRHLGHTPISFKDVTGGAKGKYDFAQVDLRKATDYAAEDADVTLRLQRCFRDRLWREEVTRIYEQVDRPVLPVIADMELAGIRVDRGALAGLSAAYEVEIARLEGEIFELAGGPFSIGSPKQLGEVLFERMGLKSGKKSSKTGAWTTDVTELERLAGEGAEIATKVLDWRQHSKLKSTYTDALQAQINPKTDRVHTNYALAATSTGRLSSNDPNLQNIPIRTELGRRIRHAFVAAPGHVLMAADYNQIELRLVAHIADVPELKRVYAEGGDVHALTAQEVFGEVTRDTRARAKTINFSIIYGISAFGLAAAARHRSRRGGALHRALFQPLPRHPQLHGRNHRGGEGTRLCDDAVRPQMPCAADRLQEPGRAPVRRARRGQRPRAGHGGRHHQAGDGADAGGARRRWPRRHEDAAAGPRRTGVRSAGRRCGRRHAGDPRGHGATRIARSSTCRCRSVSKSATAPAGAMPTEAVPAGALFYPLFFMINSRLTGVSVSGSGSCARSGYWGRWRCTAWRRPIRRWQHPGAMSAKMAALPVSTCWQRGPSWRGKARAFAWPRRRPGGGFAFAATASASRGSGRVGYRTLKIDARGQPALSCLSVPPSATHGIATGQVTSRLRAALPAGSQVTVELRDAARADAAAPLLARTVLKTRGNQMPLWWRLDFPEAKLGPPARPALSARIIDARGRLIWVSDTFTPLPVSATSTHAEAEIVVVPVRAAPSPSSK